VAFKSKIAVRLAVNKRLAAILLLRKDPHRIDTVTAISGRSIPPPTSNLKEISMIELKKLCEHIKGASTLKPHERHELANAISAVAPSMEIADLKVLNKVLSDLVAADAAKNSRKAQRLARVQAAIEDPQMQPTINYCSGRLHSLGMDINSLAASADVHALDKAMTEAKWKPDQHIGMKSALSRLGVLD
jgi:hypothetical protein